MKLMLRIAHLGRHSCKARRTCPTGPRGMLPKYTGVGVGFIWFAGDPWGRSVGRAASKRAVLRDCMDLANLPCTSSGSGWRPTRAASIQEMGVRGAV